MRFLSNVLIKAGLIVEQQLAVGTNSPLAGYAIDSRGSHTFGDFTAERYHYFSSGGVSGGSAVSIYSDNLSANSSRSQLMIADAAATVGARFGLGVYTGATKYAYLDSASILSFNPASGTNVIVGGVTDNGNKFQVVGGVSISGLSGTGTRMVVANASGVLSTQAIPTGGSGSTSRTSQTFTATSGQTVFTVTGTLVAGYFDVYLNGVRLNSSSYSSTSTTITLVDGATTGDIIDVINYDTLSITSLLPDQTGNAGKFLTTDGSNLSWATISGTGTVTSVSVVSANGFAGTVATATSTPAITLTTTVTGLVKGNGTALSAAVAGTDYQAPISLTTTGSSGAATFSSNTLNIPNYTLSGLGGQPLSTNLTSLSGLTYVSTSFVKMTAAGTFALDTNTYLTGNQTITLSGDISGTGTTAITTTIGANKVTNSMLAQVTTATIKGRITTGTGNVEDLSGTQVTTLIDLFTSTVKGVVPASGGGTTNFLRADGTWAAPPSGGGYTVTSVSTTYTETATSGTKVIRANTTGGTFTINLPTAVGNTATIIIKKVAGTPSLVVDANGTQTIDGGLTATLAKVNESITLLSDNANWIIV